MLQCSLLYSVKIKKEIFYSRFGMAKVRGPRHSCCS